MPTDLFFYAGVGRSSHTTGELAGEGQILKAGEPSQSPVHFGQCYKARLESASLERNIRSR